MKMFNIIIYMNIITIIFQVIWITRRTAPPWWPLRSLLPWSTVAAWSTRARWLWGRRAAAPSSPKCPARPSLTACTRVCTMLVPAPIPARLTTSLCSELRLTLQHQPIRLVLKAATTHPSLDTSWPKTASAAAAPCLPSARGLQRLDTQPQVTLWWILRAYSCWTPQHTALEEVLPVEMDVQVQFAALGTMVRKN